MITAEWLLKNHKNHVSYAKVLQVQLRHYTAEPEDTVDDDSFIEGMMLGSKPPDGLPHTPRYGSKTEEIAISYQDEMRSEQTSNICALQRQLRQTQYYIHLFDAVMAGLDHIEQWFVEGYYIQALSLADILRIAPDTVGEISKTTLYRKKKNLLEKIDRYLQVIQAPAGIKDRKEMHRHADIRLAPGSEANGSRQTYGSGGA